MWCSIPIWCLLPMESYRSSTLPEYLMFSWGAPRLVPPRPPPKWWSREERWLVTVDRHNSSSAFIWLELDTRTPSLPLYPTSFSLCPPHIITSHTHIPLTQSPRSPALHRPPPLHVHNHSLAINLLTIRILVCSWGGKANDTRSQRVTQQSGTVSGATYLHVSHTCT